MMVEGQQETKSIGKALFMGLKANDDEHIHWALLGNKHIVGKDLAGAEEPDGRASC